MKLFIALVTSAVETVMMVQIGIGLQNAGYGFVTGIGVGVLHSGFLIAIWILFSLGD